MDISVRKCCEVQRYFAGCYLQKLKPLGVWYLDQVVETGYFISFLSTHETTNISRWQTLPLSSTVKRDLVVVNCLQIFFSLDISYQTGLVHLQFHTSDANDN